MLPFKSSFAPSDEDIMNRIAMYEKMDPRIRGAGIVPEEQGLTDVSAFVVPRMLYGGMFKNPLTGPILKKIVPDPKMMKAVREAKRKVTNTGSIAGAGAAIGDGMYNAALGYR